MASSTDDDPDHDDEIRLWREDDWWIAKDLGTGVTTQGRFREAALANLDEAVALHDGEVGRDPTDQELRKLGTDPADDVTGGRHRRTCLRTGWSDERSPGWR